MYRERHQSSRVNKWGGVAGEHGAVRKVLGLCVIRMYLASIVYMPLPPVEVPPDEELPISLLPLLAPVSPPIIPHSACLLYCRLFT